MITYEDVKRVFGEGEEVLLIETESGYFDWGKIKILQEGLLLYSPHVKKIDGESSFIYPYKELEIIATPGFKSEGLHEEELKGVESVEFYKLKLSCDGRNALYRLDKLFQDPEANRDKIKAIMKWFRGEAEFPRRIVKGDPILIEDIVGATYLESALLLNQPLGVKALVSNLLDFYLI